jgi:hypothetical protein
MLILAPMTSLNGTAAELLEQPPPAATNSVAAIDLSPPKPTIWRDGAGSGFLSQNLTIEAGAAAGMAKLGSHG